MKTLPNLGEWSDSMKPYNPKNIPLAVSLRKKMTPWESCLWYRFLRTYPVRFQRQKAIGESIADFYCAKAQLVIELDGGGHYSEEQLQKDAKRTQALEQMGLMVFVSQIPMWIVVFATSAMRFIAPYKNVFRPEFCPLFTLKIKYS